MNICIVYSSPKLGDLIWHLPFVKIISDKYKKKVILITRSSTDAKELLKNEPYLDEIVYNEFKKGLLNYWKEIFYLKKLINNKKVNDVWILDKISRPAISGFLSNAKNVFGYGIGIQKMFLTNKDYLIKHDLKTHYISRGKKFLKLMKFSNTYEEPFINVGNEQTKFIKEKLKLSDKIIISYGVDSREPHRMWSVEKFIELIKNISVKFEAQHCIIASPLNQKIVLDIIGGLPNLEIYDCSQLRIKELAPLLKISKIFIGNDSGPYNLSAAVGTTAIGINGALKPLTHSTYFRPITPIGGDYYSPNDRPIDNSGTEIKESWIQDRISVDQVYKAFLKNIN